MTAIRPIHPIVVGHDGREQSRDALALGVALARATGDPLLVARAYAPGGRDEALRGLGHLTLDGLPPDSRLSVERRALAGASPAQVLHELAESEHPRALVLGSCHRGPVGRVLAGSVAERVLDGSPCPVAVAPRGLSDQQPVSLDTVCVGFDGRAESWSALQRAAQLAGAAGARLRITLVVEPVVSRTADPVVAEQAAAEKLKQAELALHQATASVAKRLRPEPHLVHGDPIRMLAQEGDDGVGLLVTGSRGLGPLQRVLMGSTSTALVHSAPCPVMVVPRSTQFDPRGEGMAAEDEVVETG